MQEIPNSRLDQEAANAIFDAQYATALKYTIFTPDSEQMRPTEEYLALLEEYELDFLPEIVMQALESDWLRYSQIMLSMRGQVTRKQYGN